MNADVHPGSRIFFPIPHPGFKKGTAATLFEREAFLLCISISLVLVTKIRTGNESGNQLIWIHTENENGDTICYKFQ
jgi:hypothetical protein